MIRLIATALAASAIAFTASSCVEDRFDQDTFPCAEDQVLGYAPQFGADRVGCINVEDLK